MLNLTTKIEHITVEAGKRILVTSDIHGNLSYFKKLLKKAEFSENDILFVVGDIVEKGNENLEALRYIMKLCEKGNVIPLIGNVDANRLKIIDELCEGNVNGFYKYILNLREWAGTSFYEELADECGYTLNSAEDVLAAKQAVITHFEKEFGFLVNLPTVIETQSFVFVHSGLRERRVSDNADKGIFELTKFDAFMENAENDKFRRKLVVFSYIRLAASYIVCAGYICFASDIGLRPVLKANIISLKPQVSISHFAQAKYITPS